MTPSPLVVEDLTVRVGSIEVVHQLRFALAAGQRTGLIGESGSGKTLTALAIMGLLPEGLSASGRVLYRDRDLLAMSERELCKVRGDRLAMVFQEPMTALNPVMKIGAQVAEPLRLHRDMGARAAHVAALQALERVHVPDAAEKMHAYPHQLSGGQRQRAMIAMATACSPDLLIADEPTTALDVTVQAQILKLLVELVEENGSSLLLITHDLPVVATVCQQVLVLYGGYIVEEGSVDDVFGHPRHPYTQALLDAIPPLDEDLPSRKLKAIPGSVPGLGEFPPGCPFRNRCPRADAACAVMPPLERNDQHDGDTQRGPLGRNVPSLTELAPEETPWAGISRVACWHPLT
jgi:peptide/nickel transport system ATP-binding protein